MLALDGRRLVSPLQHPNEIVLDRPQGETDMEKRSFFVKTAVVLVFAFAWLNLAPRLFPQLFPNKNNAQPAVAEKPADPLDAAGIDALGADAAPNSADAQLAADAGQTDNADPDSADPDNADAPAPAVKLAEHPHQLVELGSLDPTSGYFALVTITSTGAAVESVELNDPRYTPTDDRNQPLKIVGNDPDAELRTLQTTVSAIDDQLTKFGTTLAKVDWEMVPDSRRENEVAFRYRAPDGSVEVRKHYRLNTGDPDSPDSDPLGYQLDFELSIENLGPRRQDIVYLLQGPVGLPLEDEENSRTFIEIKAGTLEDPAAPDSVSTVKQTAAEVVKQTQEAAAGNPAAIETWKSPLQYVGVDVQYFAALILPQGNQLESRYFSEARPMLVHRNPKKDAWSDVSVLLRSEMVSLESGRTLDHRFRLFFGPKRNELLKPLHATGVQNFGWFAIISRGMLSVLNFFHPTLLAPYGLAIIMLTVVVRACMFPVSRKMAQNQLRMKELQPKMQAIREKYKDDQEKMAKEYREFMAKHGFNPLAGCLPMFLQLPIFIGLYQALYNSVDLRMAKFLWVDNLAAPDQVFAFGFALPIVGWTHFNILPLITVALFVIQQKMFMPPPTSEEQAMQYKMMNFFTIFIGFMFYKVPAGLCVYFIASSLWGICERKLLALTDGVGADASSDDSSAAGGDRDRGRNLPEPDDSEPKPPGFLQRLVEAADQAKSPTNGKQGGQSRKAKPRR